MPRPLVAIVALGFASLACVPACKTVEATGEAQQASPPIETERAPVLAESPTPTPEPVPMVEVEPPEPEPDPFPDHTTVTVAELLAALAAEVERVAASPAVRSDYEDLLARHELAHDDALYLDYVRIKLAFEATRAGGWWGVMWQITNEQPNSTLIWAQWRTLDPAALEQGLPTITAIAECDELSALFAFVVHRIGLSKRSEVGLFWPTGNHTVAVWTIDRKGEAPKRIVVPTSQIFLDGDQSLDTTGFDPRKQKTIYDYRHQDAPAELELPAALAREFVRALRRKGHLSQAELQRERNQREAEQLLALDEAG